MDTPGAGRSRLAVLAAAVAPTALLLGSAWAAALQPAGYDAARDSVLALAAADAPHRWVMSTALLVAGAALAATAAALPAVPRRGRLTLALAGVGVGATAFLPQPDRSETSAAQAVAWAVALGLLAAWPWAATRRDAPGPLSPRVGIAATLVLGALVATMVVAQATGAVAPAGLAGPGPAGAAGAATPAGTAYGAAERVVLAALLSWPLVVALGAWVAAGRPVGGTRARHVLAVLALAAACTVGGVVATILVPASAATRHYEADISLTLDPRDAGRVRAATVFGDVDIAFSGLAPGVVAVPQVRPSITDVLARPGAGIPALKPGPLELSAALTDAARAVALRFLVGGLVTSGVVLLGYAVARRRAPNRRVVVVAATAWLASAVVTGAAGWATYRTDRQAALTTTGLLGTVQSSATLLGDVQKRSEQVSPYVRNLIALTSALQERYAPTPLDEPVALRVLLVSDLHVGNAYPLMRTIVREEDIDLVVDTGDLVTFGTVEEAQRADLFGGIASLGVPYLFTRGNHDATSATDTALLRALDTVPNVVLLEPPAGGYTLVDAGGLRIAGFNDPRWFGDDGRGSARKQEPATEAFRAAVLERPGEGSGAAGPLDLVVSHEPWAVTPLAEDAGVVVNGHMHAADLEGNRVQAGSFTGGGPFSHYLENAGGEELVGQPSAFDVLSFGRTCRLTTLTRYQFRDVVEGRPAYDDVTLVNGARIDTREPQEGRACRSGAEPVLTTVPDAVTSDAGGAPAVPGPSVSP
ncbi:MAG TPA: metallophosphoesterase [Dermatophilaceae bacterium]|nr:metallophosphoesterase [Dermatophilaceae bacterium]